MLVIPARLNRNSPDVQEMGPPAETGLWLIEYMCERIGIPSLAGLDVLDLGCGVRFPAAIVDHDTALRSYVGIEVDLGIVEFLTRTVKDSRLSFAHFDVWHNVYNRAGAPLHPYRSLPIGNRKFNVVCMFSVITHQSPDQTAALLTIVRRYIRDEGHLFFSATLEEGEFGYREEFPETPTAHSIYAPELLLEIVSQTGWRLLSKEGPHPRGLPIQDSLLCAPA